MIVSNEDEEDVFSWAIVECLEEPSWPKKDNLQPSSVGVAVGEELGVNDRDSVSVLSSKTMNSDWALNLVSSVRQVVGVACEGHEEKLMALFATLEKERYQNGSKTPCKLGSKCLRKLKGLSSIVNYGGKTYVLRKTRKVGRETQKL